MINEPSRPSSWYRSGKWAAGRTVCSQTVQESLLARVHGFVNAGTKTETYSKVAGRFLVLHGPRPTEERRQKQMPPSLSHVRGGPSQEACLREGGARLEAIADVHSNIRAPTLLLGRPERGVQEQPKHLDREESQCAPCRCFQSPDS